MVHRQNKRLTTKKQEKQRLFTNFFSIDFTSFNGAFVCMHWRASTTARTSDGVAVQQPHDPRILHHAENKSKIIQKLVKNFVNSTHQFYCFLTNGFRNHCSMFKRWSFNGILYFMFLNYVSGTRIIEAGGVSTWNHSYIGDFRETIFILKPRKWRVLCDEILSAKESSL